MQRVDTGLLVAAADADDHDHDRCVAMFAAARRPWLVAQPIIAEVCYLLEREHGSQAEAAFLRSFGRRELTLVPLTVADTDRMAELVETYGRAMPEASSERTGCRTGESEPARAARLD